jgi:hypothetical protein
MWGVHLSPSTTSRGHWRGVGMSEERSCSASTRMRCRRPRATALEVVAPHGVDVMLAERDG